MSWDEYIAYCIEPEDWVCYGCCRDCDYRGCDGRIEPYQPDKQKNKGGENKCKNTVNVMNPVIAIP